MNRIFLILSIGIFCCGAYAGNCTLRECHELKVRLKAQSQTIQVESTPIFSEIVMKDATSEKYCTVVIQGICFMYQQDANNYCTSQLMHLPSARELVQLAVSFGAKGIVSNCDNDEKCNHYLVENLDKSIDEFDFSFSGYKQPTGDIGKYFLRSSSDHIPRDSSDNGYLLDGKIGILGYYQFSRFDKYSAVVCVKNR